MPRGPAECYRELTASGALESAPAQLPVIELLDDIFDALLARRRRWWRRPEPVSGAYVHGRVGRGKTLCMDLFAASLREAGRPVRRAHFNRFMDEVHARLRRAGRRRDPLRHLAGEIAGESPVLCFDEFHVDDIGDAMILGGLAGCLFAEGVTLVATSNSAPDELYAGGLQRARFLPAIESIKAHCRVLELEGREDFRLRELTRHPVYYCPIGPETRARMEAEFAGLTPGEEASTEPLRVRGRRIPVIRRAGPVVWFHFDELCAGARASADYIDLACRFSTLMVSKVPVMTDADNNAARRFIHLVDECYDRAVKLVVSASEPIEGLYRGRRLAEPFERTRSRLVEMQSHEYLARPHRP